MLTKVEVEDTFAEAFSMLAGRILITAKDIRWAYIAAKSATGFGSSIIMSPAESGIEGVFVPKDRTPDGRPGIMIQIYHFTGYGLKAQMIMRIGQCIMTCPTTSAFDGLHEAKKKIKIGRALSMFGDGFQQKDIIKELNIWRIPVMEGEFIIEDKFGVRRAIAGGNFLIMAQNSNSGLQAAEEAVKAIKSIEGVILAFPGGICRSGSKVGSNKYKLRASSNHYFCPSLRNLITDSKVPNNVNCIYEIVFNGINMDIVKKAMSIGINKAINSPNVVKISAVNFGGKLGPFQIRLKDCIL
jgi:formylmethanofuran--tetrahydromethanopterin N-formyltransferase